MALSRLQGLLAGVVQCKNHARDPELCFMVENPGKLSKNIHGNLVISMCGLDIYLDSHHGIVRCVVGIYAVEDLVFDSA